MYIKFLKNTSCSKEILLKKIVSHPSNFTFFKNNKNIKRAIETLVQKMPDEFVNFFINNKTMIFIPITGIYSCAIDQIDSNYLILLFPDLIKKLTCVDNGEGLSILAHELGHFYHQHTKKKTPTLKAQIEADDFAHKLGLSRELSEVLSRFDDLDSRTRLSYLTAKILSSNPTQ